MSAPLLFLLWAVAWGAQVAVPRQLVGGASPAPAGRKLLALPFLWLVGALAGYLLYAGRPDAAIAAELAPLWAARPGRLLVVLLLPWLIAIVVATLGRARLGAAGWWILIGFGALALLVASWVGQRLAIGAGPAPSAGAFLALVLCRALLAMVAGELVAPRLSAAAGILGALALAASFLLSFLPETAALGKALWQNRQGITALGAILLFAASAAPLPSPRLRRAALFGGLLLSAIVLSRAAELSELLGEDPTLPPMPPLPTF